VLRSTAECDSFVVLDVAECPAVASVRVTWSGTSTFGFQVAPTVVWVVWSECTLFEVLTVKVPRHLAFAIVGLTRVGVGTVVAGVVIVVGPGACGAAGAAGSGDCRRAADGLPLLVL